VGITPVNYEYFELDARRYGYSTTAPGLTNTAAINNASKVASQVGGGIVQLPSGSGNLDGALRGYANVYIAGQGPNSTIVTQQHATDHVYAAIDVGYCGVRELGLTVGPGGDGIVWRGASAKTEYLRVEHVSINLAPNPSAIGLWLDTSSNLNFLYWPLVTDLVVHGLLGGGYGTRTGIRIAGVVYGKFFACHISNLQTGIDIHRGNSIAFFGINMDDCQGGSGIGLRFRTAYSCNFYDLMMETKTFDKYILFESGSFACRIFMNDPTVAAGGIDDSGVNNEVYGDDGSGGFLNRFGMNLDLFDIRSVTLGKTSSPTGTPRTLSFLTRVTINPGTINPNSCVQVPIAIAGALPTDTVIVTPNGGLESGLAASAGARSGEILVNICNVTAAPIAAVNRQWNVDIWR
jgi:hypothetical protein